MELLIARNPDPDSRLPFLLFLLFLLLLPLAGEMVFRTSRTWPRTSMGRHRGRGQAAHTLGAAVGATELAAVPGAPEPSTAEVRAWARAAGLAVPGRGRLRPEVWAAWRAAHRG